jgi:hypothetical protein
MAFTAESVSSSCWLPAEVCLHREKLPAHVPDQGGHLARLEIAARAVPGVAARAPLLDEAIVEAPADRAVIPEGADQSAGPVEGERAPVIQPEGRGAFPKRRDD